MALTTDKQHRQASPAQGTPQSDAARERTIRRLRGLANLMDAAFAVPGTNLKFGLDGLLGLAPGVGDTFTLLASLYIVWEAKRLGASQRILTQMLTNVAIDYVIGLVPILGDAFDFAFKANRRNLVLLGIDPDGKD